MFPALIISFLDTCRGELVHKNKDKKNTMKQFLLTE